MPLAALKKNGTVVARRGKADFDVIELRADLLKSYDHGFITRQVRRHKCAALGIRGSRGD